ncbi:MAG: NUDIX hydrolase [Parachlamydiales bacterium]|jgi:8-oxo-dGTP diphosphatase
MHLQVGVKVLLKNNEGKFLLICRSAEKYKDVLQKWDIPGGRIDPGKTLIDNLEREVMEETNLRLKNNPRLVGAQDIIPNSEKHVVRLTYIGEAEGELRLSEEHTEFGWFELKELHSMENLDKYLQALLADLEENETDVKSALGAASS